MNERSRWIYVPVIIALVALAWYFKVIISYVLMAGVLSLIGQPLITFLLRLNLKGRQMPSAVAAFLTMATMFGLLLGAVGMFIPVVLKEAHRLSAIRPEDVLQSLQIPLNKAQDLLNQFQMGSRPVQLDVFLSEKLTTLFDIGTIGSSFNYLISLMGNVFVAFFSVSFITFFFLKDRQLFRTIIMAAVPADSEQRVGRVLTQSKELLTRYFIGLIVEMVIVMTVISIGLSIMGVRNAILIGFLGGLFNVIPYVGPIIGAALGMAIGIVTHADDLVLSGLLTLVSKMAAVFVVAQLLDNILLQPIIYSRSVKAHPLEIFIIIIMAGNVAGILGMIVAVPTYSILRVFAGEFLAQFKVVRSLTEERE